MKHSKEDIYNTLKQNFNFKEFRKGQFEIIQSIIDGNNALVVMPTGGGKSLCFQLPALLKQGTAIVVSPLIALMKDQIDALERNNIPASFINSALQYDQIQERMREAANGNFKLLYIAPERLDNKNFIEFLKSNINISFIAVDEAHCISEWGHDFRPAYLSIAKTLETIFPLQIVALTATATPEVQEDIISILKIPNAKRFIRGFDRPNLSYHTEYTQDKAERAIKIINSNKHESSIIYCGSRKRVELIHSKLIDAKIKASYYHAGLNDNLRKKEQEDFISNKTKIIVATNAFGMGIDKPDVRIVVHCDLTQTLEAYYQEAGRAGRDSKPSACYLLYNYADRKLMEFFIESSYPVFDDIKSVYNAIYDALGISLGQISSNTLYLSPEEIANKTRVNVSSVNSIIKLFERNKILQRNIASGIAKIRFTANNDHLREYYENSTGSNKKVLEAILRSVPAEAFYNSIEFDFPYFRRKYDINETEFEKSIAHFALAGMIDFQAPNTGAGISILLERKKFEHLPIDFNNYLKLKDNSYKKLNLVEEYAKTDQCKRNFILKYFNESDIDDVCGKCSACLGQKNNIYDENDKKLITLIIKAALELDGRFGKVMLKDYLKGNSTIKIQRYNLQDGEQFASAKKFPEDKIFDNIISCIKSNYLVLSNDLYPVVSVTNKGLALINTNIQPFKSAKQNKLPINNLYEKLKKIVDNICIKERIRFDSIISEKTLRNFSVYLPKSKKDMAELGASPAFINKYATIFLDVINNETQKEYKELHYENNQVQTVNDFVMKIINLLKQGLSIHKIEKQTNISFEMLMQHLQTAVESGFELDYRYFISEQEYNNIKTILINNKHSALKDIRPKLENPIDFHILRIVVFIARRELKILK